jgi:hypothetical protein
MTIPFQKISCWEEAEGLKTSIKEVKLHIAETKRKVANILSTRFFACCKTSTNRTANVRQLISGIKAHKFTSVFSPDN